MKYWKWPCIESAVAGIIISFAFLNLAACASTPPTRASTPLEACLNKCGVQHDSCTPSAWGEVFSALTAFADKDKKSYSTATDETMKCNNEASACKSKCR